MKLNLLISIFLLLSGSLFSQSSNLQQPTSVNADGAAPAASAMLDVQATDKGVLVPRMTSAQRTAIASPATGLLVFDTNANGFMFFNGTTWQGISGATYTAGTGIGIAGTTISNTGDTNPADDITSGMFAGGDLEGTYPNPDIAPGAVGTAEIANYSINGFDIAQMGATPGQALKWTGSTWSPGSTASSVLADADGNTKIQVEESPNEDVIRFDLGGTERMRLRKNAFGRLMLEFPDSFSNTIIGLDAGANLQSGEYNVAVGTNALSSTTMGSYNIAVGVGALRYNTSGYSNTVIGTGAMNSNTTGDFNTAIGDYSLADNTTGSNNTATGQSSLLFNTTGIENTANGALTLRSNTIGERNTAVGANSLYYNSTGSDNTASGVAALQSNINGQSNTANGVFSLRLNTSGNFNTASGVSALYSNTTGSGNTATGVSALLSNTAGNNNTATGRLSLANNTSGGFNTAVGVSALYSNTTGDENTAAGIESLFSNTTGVWNTANGAYSLRSNTIGSYNTASGANALNANTNGVSNTANGVNALSLNSTGGYNTAQGVGALAFNTTGGSNTASGVNAMYLNSIGTDNAAFGIGSLSGNTAGVQNTAIGAYSLSNTTGSSGNTALGFRAGYFNNNGFYNTFLGSDATASGNGFFNSIAIGNSALATASLQVRIGGSFITSIGGYQNWSNLSDGRFKKNVKADVPGLEFILKLRPVTYHLDVAGLSEKLDEKRGKERDELLEKSIAEKEKMRFSGFVAQEVEQAAAATGYDFSGVDKPKNAEDFYGLRYAEFVVPLVKAMQEQQVMIEKLEKENAGLKSQMGQIIAAFDHMGWR